MNSPRSTQRSQRKEERRKTKIKCENNCFFQDGFHFSLSSLVLLCELRVLCGEIFQPGVAYAP
jgi:hypothetical protein